MSRSEGPPDLVIVGSVAFDSIETPWGKVERVLGGSATYASLAASLFCKPAIVGVVGDDFGEAEERLLSGRGVDLSGLERRRGKTFFWHGRYFEDADRRESIVTELGVFADFRPLLPERLRRAPLAFIAN
ncbi:MAG TPA: sugar kinase, partial [Armatimonadetes bacterium]|nr:sugar kinase [Armatimonadota bacterium]